LCISTNHLWIDMGVYIFFVVAMSVWKSVGISVGGIGVSVVMYAWMSVEMAVVSLNSAKQTNESKMWKW
jgi:hypothetical protein